MSGSDPRHDSHDERARQDEGVDLVREAVIAERNASMRERGRKIGGTPGAVMAGMMIALRDIVEAPPRDPGSVVVDSPTEPVDVDRDGVELGADDVGGADSVFIEAQERRAPIVGRRRARRR